MYSVDTSSFMDWQARFYPPDVFVSLERRIEALIGEGRFRAVDLVAEEIGSVGTPDLQAWTKRHKGIFLPLTAEVQIEAVAIEARYPDLLDPKVPYQSADAYVIALAKLSENGIVVSQETSASEKRNPRKNHFVPDVCRDLGVPCINLLGLMRREKWTI